MFWHPWHDEPQREVAAVWAGGDRSQGRVWEELPLIPWGLDSLFLEAPGQDLLLLLAAPLNMGIMCSNNINKHSSSHRESFIHCKFSI